MVQKEKLVQFYFNQYRDWSRAYKKKNNEGKKTYEQRIDRLLEDMQAPRGRLSQAHLEEFHRQLRNLAYFSFRVSLFFLWENPFIAKKDVQTLLQIM